MTMATRLMITRTLALLALIAPSALLAAEDAAESCTAIRARIGVAPLADPDLLRTLAARKDCAFTAAEVYRAAYGDRPPPPPDDRERPRHRHHDDED